MKNILVFGSNGMLGYAVTEYFTRKDYQVQALTRNDFDIAKDDISKLDEYISNADLVINCAGIIKPRIQDFSVEDVLKVNGVFPINLAKLCKKLDVKMFHITTDCVYSGKKGKYTEEDYFDAEDLYGLSKNFGDFAESMVIRTSIIGPEKGQKRSLLEWALSQKGKEVNGFTNHKWNGVTTLYLTEIIEKIWLKDLYEEGIFHIYSPRVINKYELLNQINQVYNLNLTIRHAKAEYFCDRSLLSVRKISKELSTLRIYNQVEDMRQFFI